jgi:aconitate hydratase
VAESFERIHRSNLIGMAIVPLQLPLGTTAGGLGLDGNETFDVLGWPGGITPRITVTMQVYGEW